MEYNITPYVLMTSVIIYNLLIYYISRILSKDSIKVFVIISLLIGHYIYWKDIKKNNIELYAYFSLIVFIVMLVSFSYMYLDHI